MASNARSSSSGVRNLRAMFETGNNTIENSTSPPPRGRSPADENVASNNSARPLSTVRTSFVAVDRSGLLKRINGDGGVEGKADMKVGTASKDKPKDGSSEALANGKTVSQGVSNVASETTVNYLEKPTSSGGVQKSAAMLPADPKGKAVVAASAAANEQPPSRDKPERAAAPLSAAEIPLPDTPKPTEKTKTKMPIKGKAPIPMKSGSEKGKEKSVSTKPAATTMPRENASRPSPAPISVPKDAATTKATAKAPAPAQVQAQTARPPAKLPKTPTTPNNPSHSTMTTAKPRAPPTTTTETIRAPTKKPSRASIVPSMASASSAAPKSRAPAGSSSSTALSRPALQSSPKSKANHKSPTRPARLPTSIVAPTASSAAKTSNNPPSRSHSRESSSLRLQAPTIQKTDKPSPTRSAATASVRRQPSRPSLPERPHSRNAAASRKSLSGSTAAPDEGFLARMMRPTASSASKTHEKLQEKTHDKLHEKGDVKIVRKVKSVIKGTTKNHDGESVATGEAQKDQHHEKTEEVKINDPGDVEQENASAAASENEKPTDQQVEEEKALVLEETSMPEEGDDLTAEDAPPVSDTVPELPEAPSVVAAAG